MPPVSPPANLENLIARCDALAGNTVGRVATQLGLETPADLRRHKGWLGCLLEQALGATGNSQAVHDFPDLGVELKTLPLDHRGLPKESTYVCHLPMRQHGAWHWQDSWVCHKLSHVLWLPIEADPAIPLADRMIGQGFLWRPNPEQLAILQQDWQELMDAVILGQQDDLSAKSGVYLQIRPKAADSKARVRGVSEDGAEGWINPRGFYLRTGFTREVLMHHIGRHTLPPF